MCHTPRIESLCYGNVAGTFLDRRVHVDTVGDTGRDLDTLSYVGVRTGTPEVIPVPVAPTGLGVSGENV